MRRQAGAVGPGAGPAALLAARAAEAPPAPWLFFRDGFDWRWRSWARVADQVARGARSCRDWLAGNPGRPAIAGCRPRLHPDAVAAALALAAADFELDLTLAADFEIGLPGEPGELRLPPCRDAFEALPATRLDTSADGAAVVHEVGRWSWQQLEAAAGRFDQLVADHRRGGPARPILLASTAQPRMFAVLLAWSLRAGAAWVLEEDRDQLAANTWWTRPTVLVATASELEDLAGHFDASCRRRSRLRSVVVIDGEVDDAVSEALGTAAQSFDPR